MRRAGILQGGIVAAIAGLALSAGCAAPAKGPVVFYLDGAGWYGSGGAVEHGLRKAGYTGAFRTHPWSAYLGPAHDHLVTARSKSVARDLAKTIEKQRKSDPQGRIDVMALSAGTAVVIHALELLPRNVQVDNVVLFSSSASADHDLSRAMRRVRRNFYATCSRNDALLKSIATNADGLDGPPAGIAGFRLPYKYRTGVASSYDRVVNIPWQPQYAALDNAGGHTAATAPEFIAGVIAPRVLANEPFPLDRSVAAVYRSRLGASR